MPRSRRAGRGPFVSPQLILSISSHHHHHLIIISSSSITSSESSRVEELDEPRLVSRRPDHSTAAEAEARDNLALPSGAARAKKGPGVGPGGALHRHLPLKANHVRQPMASQSAIPQVESLSLENVRLRERVEALQEENERLKWTVFELTNRLSVVQRLIADKLSPIALDGAFGIGTDPSSNSNTDDLTGAEASGRPSAPGIASPNQDPTKLPRITLPQAQGPGPGPSPAHLLAPQGAALTPIVPVTGELPGLPSANGLGIDKTVAEEKTNGSREPALFGPGHSFVTKAVLKSHRGAVYVCRWSPCGRFLASGSLDRTVRVWTPFAGASAPATVATAGTPMHSQRPADSVRLDGHAQLICDVRWYRGSASVASASFDKTVRIWDVEVGSEVAAYRVDGLIQALEVAPSSASAAVFCGTNKPALLHVDPRSANPVATWQNPTDGMVASIFAHADGQYLLTGDSRGFLQTWCAPPRPPPPPHFFSFS